MFSSLNATEAVFRKLTPLEQVNAPKELFIKGDKTLLTNGNRVAIIGSRKASGDGLKRAASLAKILVENKIIVVSGLAQGIDTASHRGAIEAGGKTVAVIGTPLDQTYPASNKDLQQQIANGHLQISQFPTRQTVSRGNFPARNKTMALISEATVIVEAYEGSGVLHQANECIRLGRALYIMESAVNDKSLSWPARLISQGAKVLTRDNVKTLINEILKI